MGIVAHLKTLPISTNQRRECLVMCLAVPAQVKFIDGQYAEIETHGVSRKISIALTPAVKAGDYVLIHAGYAITVIDQKEALETFALFDKLDLG